MESWVVSAVQMTSTADVRKNTARAERWIRRAAGEGAHLVALPENFARLVPEGTPPTLKESLDGPLVRRFGELARECGCRILLGSIPERRPRSPRIHNTSVLLAPDGSVEAAYRKMHLFDIDIRGGAVFRESKTVEPGDRPALADTPLGKLGLSICYDLRFPELYRALALAGADVLFVPAAFTAYTGPFHWMTLLRARAIENQCWVVAPAQSGRHSARRQSHGETTVIDPWGEVVACRKSGEGLVTAVIDLQRNREVRAGLPCLQHVRRELVKARRRF